MSSKETYCRLVKEQARAFEKRYDEYCRSSLESPENGLRCDDLAPYAYLETALFVSTGDEVYAHKAIRALTDMGRLSDQFLEQSQTEGAREEKTYTVRQAVLNSGRPPEAPMETMFCPTYYLLAYHCLKERDLFTREEQSLCQKAVFRSIRPLFAYTDWGPQNRGMIKGSNLVLAGVCFPEADRAEECLKLGRILCGESLGKWSIEDAQVYMPIWMNQIILYQEICGDDRYFDSPIVRYYFEYMRNLMTPEGMMPEFGDGRYLNSAEAYIACLEKGAALYRDGRMKYAARKITEYMTSKLDPYESTLNNVCFLASALLWSDDTVREEPFQVESGEILDDVIGKKYRFCNGEGMDRQYLLFNYRDEGNYDRRVRDYMRSTLVVEQEKMHHGHSDENSIVLLTAGNSILLHDGGYREMDGVEKLIPGSYRSDFYHNRPLVRREILPETEDFIDFLSKEPAYFPADTDKIYFEKFPSCQAARTRIEDHVRKAQVDRTIIYDKENVCYLVIDTLTARENRPYTFGVLYYGDEVISEDERTFSLVNREIVCDQPVEKHFPLSQEYTLRVMFPQKEMRIGTRQIRRCYHQETGLYQVFSGSLKKGESLSLVSVLQPVKQEKASAKLHVQNVLEQADGLAVQIDAEGCLSTYAVRYDLDLGCQAGIARPLYEFSRRGLHLGKLYTDALFAHTIEKESGIAYELLSFTRAEYDGTLLFQVPASSLIQGDWKLAEKVPEWNIWFGEAKK